VDARHPAAGGRRGPRLATRGRPVALLMALLLSCSSPPVNGGSGTRPTYPPGTTAAPSPVGTVLPVVVGAGAHPSYLDGMELAASETGTLLDVREAGAPLDVVREAVAAGPPAVFVVGAPDAVAEARPEIEAVGVPVILVGGDLYTDRRLFRHGFQTAIPLRWQARVLARYLVVDREHDRIAVVGNHALGAEALAEEGVSPADSAREADAVLALGSPRVRFGQTQVATANAVLPRPELPPSSVTCVPYTWAGWADMLPRVHGFRTRFERATGHPPVGFEQEGYDAVRALAEALDRTGGEGGDELIRALESYREETYSSLPIRLGPDDHVFAEESQLGLFAVAAPGERPFSGEVLAEVPWRPIMRTFTTDGQKVNLLDRDKKLFFPGWNRRKPSPRYWKSRFGIVTRPDEDPLH
ncbi:MAG: ABC transporter substrate-binding protein, partial [Actinomycetota bacterium]